jgi:DNA-binding transcriptional LysR family regulator
LGGRILMEDVLVPVVAPKLLEQSPPMRTPESLRGLPLLRTPIDPWTPWFRAAGLDWPEPASGPKLVDLGLLLEAACAGLGVALARPSLARRWLAAGQLCVPFNLPVAASSQYQLLPHADSAASNAFADWLTLVCSQAGRNGQEAISGLG